MTWSYDATDLDTDTASGRLNSVRLLVGDTNTTDQQLQDEEINFSLSQTNNNVYSAASFCAGLIASSYSRKVTTELDGQLMAEYSDLSKQYRSLARDLKEKGKSFGNGGLGILAGGIRVSVIDTVRADTDRVTPAFRTDRFRNPQNQDIIPDYEQE